MPWEGGINMSWGGGGEGFNMPWKGGTCFGGGGDNMIKCLGGEGQHAFGGGSQGKGILTCFGGGGHLGINILLGWVGLTSAVQVFKPSGIEYNPVKVISRCVVVQMEVIISSSSHTFLRIKCRVVKDPPSLLFSSSYSCKNANPDLQE